MARELNKLDVKTVKNLTADPEQDKNILMVAAHTIRTLP
jgi:hypothetical protein